MRCSRRLRGRRAASSPSLQCGALGARRALPVARLRADLLEDRLEQVNDESTCSRASARAPAALPATSACLIARCCSAFFDVEPVERMVAGRPHRGPGERPPRALRQLLDERQAGDAIDDVVERVVPAHPVAHDRAPLLAGLARAELLRDLREALLAPRRAPASSSGVIFVAATSVASASSSARTMNASCSSSREIVRTRTPRFGTNETSPSAASRRSASRTGVRETLNCSDSCSWRRTVPGASSPETIASSITSAMSSALCGVERHSRRVYAGSVRKS